MGLTRLTRLLGSFNGIVLGTFLGVVGFVSATSEITLFGILEATVDIGGYAVGASTSTTVTSRVTEYPLGPIWAGILGGAVGAGLALYLPPALSVPVASDILQQVLTGLIAGGVVGTLTRLLPGL